MFESHNGHEMIELPDIIDNLKSSISKLGEALKEADRKNQQQIASVSQLRKQIDALKDKQVQNIEHGFK